MKISSAIGFIFILLTSLTYTSSADKLTEPTPTTTVEVEGASSVRAAAGQAEQISTDTMMQKGIWLTSFILVSMPINAKMNMRGSLAKFFQVNLGPYTWLGTLYLIGAIVLTTYISKLLVDYMHKEDTLYPKTLENAIFTCTLLLVLMPILLPLHFEWVPTKYCMLDPNLKKFSHVYTLDKWAKTYLTLAIPLYISDVVTSLLGRLKIALDATSDRQSIAPSRQSGP